MSDKIGTRPKYIKYFHAKPADLTHGKWGRKGFFRVLLWHELCISDSIKKAVNQGKGRHHEFKKDILLAAF
jgi:hypothetical protein